MNAAHFTGKDTPFIALNIDDLISIIKDTEKISKCNNSKTQIRLGENEHSTYDFTPDSRSVNKKIEIDTRVFVRQRASLTRWPQIEYKIADISAQPLSAEEFCSGEFDENIKETIIAIIDAEAPILKDLLVHRVCFCHNVSAAKYSTKKVEKLLRSMELIHTRQTNDVVFWSASLMPESFASFRTAQSTCRRTTTQIPYVEIKNACCRVLEEKGNQSTNTLIKLTARYLGYMRTGGTLHDIIEEGIRFAEDNGAIAKGKSNRWMLVA